MSNEDALLTTLVDQDDITWQTMLFDLVNSEQMDPWDVDVTILADRFISMINEMRETNLRISGKVILACTIMLRLKSGRFIDTDLAALEQLIASMNSDDFDEFEEEGMFSEDMFADERSKKYKIYPRSPQPRKRKVSVYDLVHALEGVIEKQKKVIKKRSMPKELHVEIKNVDMNIVLRDVFTALNTITKKKASPELKFSEILPSDKKEDILATFIPLLHLTNQRVTDLFQQEAFSDFDVHLLKKGLTFSDLEKIESDQE